ncbi:MAG: ABC transporter substrate-binding protein [Chitinophagales bacterium]
MQINRIAVCFLFLVVMISSCRHESENADKTIFRLNLATPLTSLDPAFASDQSNTWSVNQLFSGLVQLDTALNVMPCLAKSWEIADDRKTYTFHLRNDVFFHDDACFPNGKGRKLVAADVVYSFYRLIDPATAARGNWVFQNIVDSISPFYAINDSTVKIKLQQPFAPFLQRLSIQYCSVVPKEAIDLYGKDFRSHPVGTGPFKFLKWEEGELLILHKFENYFERDEQGNKLPYLDAVNIQFNTNKSTEFLKFLSGELDFVSDIDAALKDNILTKEGNLQEKYNDKIKLLKGPYLNVEYFSILMDTSLPIVKENPLSFIEVRKAINYGFDKDEMLLFLKNNRGIAATGGIVPPSLLPQDIHPHYGYTYNPDTALQLLAAAGFENGVGLPEIVLHTTEQYQDIAIYVKDKLEDIGIAIKVETVDPRLLREMRLNASTVLFRSSWIADYADAENYLTVFYGGSEAPPNYTRFHNPQFDSLYTIAVAESDETLRKTLYYQMDSILMQQAPVVPLFYDEVYRFVQNNITGLRPNALNMLELKRVWMG